MKKVKYNERVIFENSSINLNGVFKNILHCFPSGELYQLSEDKWTLKVNSLIAEYSEFYDLDRKKEILTIKKDWRGHYELITIDYTYTDLKEWIIEEVLGYLSLFDKSTEKSINRIKSLINENGIAKYKDHFALDLTGLVYEINKSSFNYETNNIFTGVQSLLSLGNSILLGQNTYFFKRLFEKVMREEEINDFLNVSFGRRTSMKKKIDFLKSKHISCPKFSGSFSYSEEANDNLLTNHEYELLSLCKYYAFDKDYNQ